MIDNFFKNLPTNADQEQLTTLLQSQNVRIERILSFGDASPEGFWYDQPQDEWVIVLQGAARMALENGVVELEPGDFLNLPAHTKHRVTWTTPDEPTLWLAIHYGESELESRST